MKLFGTLKVMYKTQFMTKKMKYLQGI